MGLSPDRRVALQAVIDSLPLGKRERERAQETLENADNEQADQMIALHKKLVEGLPAALAAVKRIRGLS